MDLVKTSSMTSLASAGSRIVRRAGALSNTSPRYFPCDNKGAELSKTTTRAHETRTIVNLPSIFGMVQDAMDLADMPPPGGGVLQTLRVARSIVIRA